MGDEPTNPMFKSSKIVLIFSPLYKIVVMNMSTSKDNTLEINVIASDRRQFVLISTSFMNTNKLPSVSNYNTTRFPNFQGFNKIATSDY
jgi:hypothetical protein